MAGRILVVEDDAPMRELLSKQLDRRGFVTQTCDSASGALELLSREAPDVVITDLHMKGMGGLELCQRIVELRPDVPVLVITAFGSLETAVAAIRAGAYDFITKPFEIEALILALERAVAHRALREEVKRLRQVVASEGASDTLLGQSEPMHRLRQLVARVAETDSSVLITGDSGTGKEVVARELHGRGRRKGGPFVAINCAAMPESLLEAELFGHAKGAFTDARTARQGLFLRAQGGTLFLDEIGELPLGLQPKLLRALQERTVRPLGSGEEQRFDARIIAATNRDLESAVEERRFREDLFFRINVISIALPPLRARSSDVLLLAQSFLGKFAQASGKRVRGISSAAGYKLVAYPWPGNVRELQNCIERAVALTEFEEITVEDLPEKIRAHRPSEVVVITDDTLVPLEEVERRYILHVLQAVGGHRTQAAKVLGLDRKTLYRKLELYGEGTKGPGDP
jgi:two-component system, NtrC family, response regulator AtoC